MSKHEMLDTFKKHVDAELAGDLETTMATMTADPHLHNVPSMVGGVGRDGVRKFYKKPFGRQVLSARRQDDECFEHGRRHANCR
jgi:hypothetical protein